MFRPVPGRTVAGHPVPARTVHDRSARGRRVAAATILGAAALTQAVGLTAPAQAAAPDAIRVGGPSAPADVKRAVVGTQDPALGRSFRVVDAGGRTVLRGKLLHAVGSPAPWRHVQTADLTAVRTPGRYRVVVGRMVSRAWVVKPGASSEGIAALLRGFDAQRDGDEPSALHGPSHRNDAAATIANGPFAGAAVDVSGGWMDAGDMLKFTQTTAYAAAMLQYAARIDPRDAVALRAAADTGVRFLVKAHPQPGLFIAQVGDARDHDLGFRDPASDDASGMPGIGRRLAFAGMGGDLGGKAALALALAAQRAPAGAERDALTRQAREWYAAGVAAGGPMRQLPDPAGDFYLADTAEDALAAGAAALFRLTGEPSFLDEAVKDLGAVDGDGRIAWDALKGLAAADLCGQLGAPTVRVDAVLDEACGDLIAEGHAALVQAGHSTFATPGRFGWGQVGENGGAGALAILAGRAGLPGGGLRVGTAARDWLLGRNPWGTSFVVGYGPGAPRHPHHWASAFGDGLPVGAVVGGPAPLKDIREQGFTPAPGPFDTASATYEDRADDYVTSEPAIDYAAGSVLLLAALAG